MARRRKRGPLVFNCKRCGRAITTAHVLDDSNGMEYCPPCFSREVIGEGYDG